MFTCDTLKRLKKESRDAVKFYPSPDWLLNDYPGWVGIWNDVMWTKDELRTFNLCPIDMWETG
jgi:hypothetical protein